MGALLHPRQCLHEAAPYRPFVLTSPPPPARRLTIQPDANVCIVDVATNAARWCARAVSAPTGAYFLLLGDDGSACVHAGTYGTPTASQETMWCSPAAPAPTAPMRRIPGGVVFNHTVGTVISKCSFTKMGGAGLDIHGGSQHNSVSGIYAADISGSAIQVGGIEPCPACPTCGIAPNGTPFPAGVCPTTLPSPSLDLNNTIVDSVIAGQSALNLVNRLNLVNLVYAHRPGQPHMPRCT